MMVKIGKKFLKENRPCEHGLLKGTRGKTMDYVFKLSMSFRVLRERPGREPDVE